MPVDSFKFLPKSFRPMFESMHIEVDGPVWAPFEKPLSEATIAVLSSAGVFLKDIQEPFEVERESPRLDATSSSSGPSTQRPPTVPGSPPRSVPSSPPAWRRSARRVRGETNLMK